MNILKASFCAVTAALAFALPAQADNTGSAVFGTLAFGANGANGGQYWSPQNTVIGAGVEYYYADAANIDTADFTGTQLIINDMVLPGFNANGWKMTFTGFSQMTLVSSDFNPGLTYGLNGSTIEVNWVGVGDAPHNFTAVFDVTAVPEPGTYALMLAGLAGVGFVARRRMS